MEPPEPASGSGSRLKRARSSLDIEDFDESQDAAPTLPVVGKPKGCASLGMEDIPDGPTTFRELFLWNSDVVDRLRLEHSNQQKPWVQKEFTICLTSSYSGLGMAEIAANFVSHAFLKHGVKVHVNSYAMRRQRRMMRAKNSSAPTTSFLICWNVSRQDC